jgi:hypothetical protein
MTLNLINIEDDKVRELMLEEVEYDIKKGKIYFSPRLNDESKEKYLELLKKSIQEGDDKSFANNILKSGCFKPVMSKKTRSGKSEMARVPNDAHFILAEGEFNRYYLRAICLKAIANNKELELYLSKPVESQRFEAKKLVGEIVNPTDLLNDLRENVRIDSALGLSQGPNSWLSAKIN